MGKGIAGSSERIIIAGYQYKSFSFGFPNYNV